MRKVKISGKNLVNENGVICCPLQNHPQSDGICHPSCAWFKIEDMYGQGNRKDDIVFRNAWCGDKIIGEIVEAKDG